MTPEARVRAKMLGTGQLRPGDPSRVGVYRSEDGRETVVCYLTLSAIERLKSRLVKAGILTPKRGAQVLSIETGLEDCDG